MLAVPTETGNGVPGQTSDARSIVVLRRELALAERVLREKAQGEAAKLTEAERDAWEGAHEACLLFDRIRPRARARLDAIRTGDRERFGGERRLAEIALRDADRADAAYTIVSFANLRDRLRYLWGGSERESVVREALVRGGVHVERGHFQEIVK